MLSLKVGLFVLLKSTDGGISWTALPNLPSNTRMSVIAFSPNYGHDHTVYIAGTGGLFETTNQGGTWSLANKQALASVALSPNFARDNTLFAVSSKDVLESTDRGQTWSTLSSPLLLTSSLSAIAVSPNYAEDKTLLLGSTGNGIFESTNSGTSWSLVSGGLAPSEVTSLHFSPAFATDQTIFASTLGSGVLTSTNGGITFKSSNSGLSDLKVTSLALSPTYTQDSTLWATTAVAGVFQSTSAAGSWTLGGTISRTLSNLTNIHYQTVQAASTSTGVTLVLGMYEGVWTSSSSPISWQYSDTIPTRLIRYINISPTYATDQTIFASTYGGANLWSTTGGSTWTFENTGMQLAYTDASAISPNFAADGMAFAGNANGLQRTSDRGATWQLMKGIGSADYPRGLALSPDFAVDCTALIGTTTNGAPADEGMFLSHDCGSTWTATNVSGKPINGVAVSPAFATDQTAFAASPSNGLYKSTTGGASWTPLTLPLKSQQVADVAVSPAFASDGTVFAAGVNGAVLKSVNRGGSWTLVAGTTTIRALTIQLSPNYANDQTLFIGTAQVGLLKATQGGASISHVSSFMDNLVTAVAFSPNFAADNTVFAAAYHGLYKSTDGGTTWAYTVEPARIEDSRTVKSRTPPQQPPTIVYEGTWGFITAPPASTNTYAGTTVANSTATLFFYGSGVRWISRTGPTQGTATVRLDGVSQGTVNLYAPAPPPPAPPDQYQQNVWEQHGIPCGPHTFTVVALPQSGQSVTVDAFDVWVDTCPLVGITTQ